MFKQQFYQPFIFQGTFLYSKQGFKLFNEFLRIKHQNTPFIILTQQKPEDEKYLTPALTSFNIGSTKTAQLSIICLGDRECQMANNYFSNNISQVITDDISNYDGLFQKEYEQHLTHFETIFQSFLLQTISKEIKDDSKDVTNTSFQTLLNKISKLFPNDNSKYKRDDTSILLEGHIIKQAISYQPIFKCLIDRHTNDLNSTANSSFENIFLNNEHNYILSISLKHRYEFFIFLTQKYLETGNEHYLSPIEDIIVKPSDFFNKQKYSNPSKKYSNKTLYLMDKVVKSIDYHKLNVDSSLLNNRLKHCFDYLVGISGHIDYFDAFQVFLKELPTFFNTLIKNSYKSLGLEPTLVIIKSLTQCLIDNPSGNRVSQEVETLFLKHLTTFINKLSKLDRNIKPLNLEHNNLSALENNQTILLKDCFNHIHLNHINNPFIEKEHLTIELSQSYFLNKYNSTLMHNNLITNILNDILFDGFKLVDENIDNIIFNDTLKQSDADAFGTYYIDISFKNEKTIDKKVLFNTIETCFDFLHDIANRFLFENQEPYGNNEDTSEFFHRLFYYHHYYNTSNYSTLDDSNRILDDFLIEEVRSLISSCLMNAHLNKIENKSFKNKHKI